MKKDTKTFLLTIFGIPLILGGVWGAHTSSQGRVVIFERAPVVTVEPEIPQSIQVPPEVAITAPAPAAVPVRTPVATKPVSQPATVPQPVVVPTAPVVATSTTIEPAPKAVAAKKKSRRTRAS